MSEIHASMVRDLRDKTGAGMMDCKKALVESGGDMEAAIDWLRKKGLSAAAKKSGRVAAEGLVGVASAPNVAAMVEVNAETDFIARNEQFQNFVSEVAGLILSVGYDIETIKAAPFTCGGKGAISRSASISASRLRKRSARRSAVAAALPELRRVTLPVCSCKRSSSARLSQWLMARVSLVSVYSRMAGVTSRLRPWINSFIRWKMPPVLWRTNARNVL